MGAQLRGVEVYYSYHDERFHIHLPATLAPIIGKQGVLQCRLDAVRRPGASAPIARSDVFEAGFGADRRLIIPSLLANASGIAGGASLDITILARLDERRGWFRTRIDIFAIYPNDTVIFDHGDMASSRFASPSLARNLSGPAEPLLPAFGENQRQLLSPWQLARAIERELAEPVQVERESPPTQPQAPSEPAKAAATDVLEVAAPTDDEAADRRRWLEVLELYHAAKEGRVVIDNTRRSGIVEPEQPFRRMRSG